MRRHIGGDTLVCDARGDVDIPRRTTAHGEMVALRGTEIELVPLEKAVATLTTVPAGARPRPARSPVDLSA